MIYLQIWIWLRSICCTESFKVLKTLELGCFWLFLGSEAASLGLHVCVKCNKVPLLKKIENPKPVSKRNPHLPLKFFYAEPLSVQPTMFCPAAALGPAARQTPGDSSSGLQEPRPSTSRPCCESCFFLLRKAVLTFSFVLLDLVAKCC